MCIRATPIPRPSIAMNDSDRESMGTGLPWGEALPASGDAVELSDWPLPWFVAIAVAVWLVVTCPLLPMAKTNPVRGSVEFISGTEAEEATPLAVVVDCV